MTRWGRGSAAGVLLATLWLGSISYSGEATSDLQFRVAAVLNPKQPANHEVSFEPFFPLGDWADIARHNLHEIDYDHPDLSKLREGLCGGVEHQTQFRYDAPLPQERSPGFYYALSALGVVQLTPERLMGRVIFDGLKGGCGEKSNVVPSPGAAMGSEVARTSDGREISDVGFVLMSDRPRDFQMTPVPVGAAKRGSYALTPVQFPPFGPGGERRKPYPFIQLLMPSYIFSDASGPRAILQYSETGSPLRKAYLLTISDEDHRYLFVFWHDDTSGPPPCVTSEYSLLRISEDEVSLAKSAYSSCFTGHM